MKKAFSIIAALILLTTLFSASAAANTGTMNDALVNLLEKEIFSSEFDNDLNTLPSKWALTEVIKAEGYGLATEGVLDNFRANITREEFCELVVLLYEALSGNTAEPTSPNPFNDTDNPEILKAYNLGIVNGVSENQFAPGSAVTRQEISVMLTRALIGIDIDLDTDTSNTVTFTDEDQIASWAIEAVRYLYEQEIMKGVGENTIDPLGFTTREQAMALIVRVFESKTKITWQESDYYGYTDNNTPHSFGTFVYPNGDTYIGEINYGAFDGSGLYYTALSGDLFFGEYADGVISGYGICLWGDGDLYMGEFVNSQLHGEGLYIWADGHVYYGSFENGLKHGYGTEANAEGEIIADGMWSNGKFIGDTTTP